MTERDYRFSILLPKTRFPMKANLARSEQKWLALWDEIDLYRRLRQEASGRPRFILHDGPPYANGDIHIGHAMNKILKDVIVKSRQMTGYDSPYVPGWDCHGLPIEWKIEEKYRSKGKNKDDVDPIAFRQECRAFASHWIDVQKEQFRRLGIVGDWEDPYTTMNFESEAKIVSELMRFTTSGALYRGSKPVMWSPVEKTALAEAEIEYHDHRSTMIDVAFPISEGPEEMKNARLVIWTTTPWTIPGNRAISYSPDINYNIIEVRMVSSDAFCTLGDRFVIASDLAPDFAERAHIEHFEIVAQLPGDKLSSVICAHPWVGKGYDFPVPLIPGDHVTTEQGTGLVHTAPGHGEDDFLVCQAHGIVPPLTVQDDGRYYDTVPLVAGAHVYKVDQQICDLLRDSKALLSQSTLVHSYPHSWRSKAPLIFRNTPQWFISMEHGQLRDVALKAISETRFVPEQGRTRMKLMIETRPDWVLSRQRAWGVPIAVFVHKKDETILCDEAVNNRIIDAVRAEGADAWYKDKKRFLGDSYSLEDYMAVEDILDVWFDSGCTHSFVVEDRPELSGGESGCRSSLYLEGSDQHRGWFQSSLLESCGTRGQAPFETVMTHGFVLDRNGEKMSKSKGNVISPQDIVKEYGADILRLWVISTDYFEDVRIGKEILSTQVDSYRKIRNSFRYLLGALQGEEDVVRVIDPGQYPLLERWVLHRLASLDKQLRAWIDDYDYGSYYKAIHRFCQYDLSTFYFDIRKDRLYCDSGDSAERRACLAVMQQCLTCLMRWLAPILSFTCEEVYQMARDGEGPESIHLTLWPEIPESWHDEDLGRSMQRMMEIRSVITGALEEDRREGRIGSSLEAAVDLYLTNSADDALIKNHEMTEIAIVSDFCLKSGAAPDAAFALDEVPGVAVTTHKASGGKCLRCWRVRDDLGGNPDHPDLCKRCTDVVVAIAC